MANPAQQNRFKVIIDELPLGSFTKCDGLKASYEIKEYKEGGQNSFVHHIPGRVNYGNITLTRPVDDSTKAVGVWFSSFRVAVRRATATIVALDAVGEEVFAWVVSGVFPVSWSASGLDANGNGVLTETLELSHDGFNEVGMGASAIA
jgi:phage tail-like protein